MIYIRKIQSGRIIMWLTHIFNNNIYLFNNNTHLFIQNTHSDVVHSKELSISRGGVREILTYSKGQTIT